MESQLAFLDCPAYQDEEGLARCGLPAEVLRRFIMESTDGPLESVMIKCPVSHLFTAPVEFLSLKRSPRAPGGTASAQSWRPPTPHAAT